ncbi:40S ribosomal protein S17, putative [Plasmodium vivax]|uniref:40S ribosomal protein S17, putative n=11 Tax=Plasmodium TaxID=5820 RepID=A0A5K1VER9_PLAKH|nr:40S ribosomal protein S17, putative [Plasmodium vivax]XP_002262499.1 40S ribosomal protein S17, putative [Plasmodium knowlesi strain H]XP_004225192.1 40S ribosomal protein S17 [Plasmodium cynomolgi strain B]XP_019917728.1 40S ribosomal protein S17 [Plasmodium coatneyi]KMZ77511.1 ribosomal S17 [Plasmodium vivax India VII]KMZ84673.1 ribosomal S17 [Plasmodium vivax Brazil I]KMZ89951.1 ribosomal S17 [Plasmodium vivax Mauritania I]KMZ96671.1 ribosomal S17 [Plasmodium vivax North Korean]OTN643|eukprot:XP_002262499.1 40s ribosomal protein s17, putative [Plasmodium knowlesi strain H]
MGRVRTKTIKRAARQIVEKYYAKLTLDFQINKKITEEVAIIPSKRMKNKVAGFVTHLMKRIQKGPVRGISLKLQEEERERRLDFVPEKSQIDVNVIYVEPDTVRMIKALGINISNMKVHNPMINSNQQKQNRMNTHY